MAVPLIGDSIDDPQAIGSHTLGGVAAAVILASFVTANYAYQGALPFYNAVMFELVPPARNKVACQELEPSLVILVRLSELC